MFPSSSSIVLRLLPASPQTTPRWAGPPRFATGAHDSPPELEGTKVRERNRGGELARKQASKRKGMQEGRPAGRQHDGGRGQQSTGTLIPLGKNPLFAIRVSPMRCLRMHVGTGLLRETWLIIAHLVSTNSFVDHYGINFPVLPNAMPMRMLWPGGFTVRVGGPPKLLHIVFWVNVEVCYYCCVNLGFRRHPLRHSRSWASLTYRCGFDVAMACPCRTNGMM